MKHFRQFFKVTASFTLVLLLSISAFAQDITAEKKADVLKGLEKVITRYAFVPGVDFSAWQDFMADQQSKIDEAKTDDEFALAVNTALREFGFSHIVMMTPKAADIRQNNATVGIGVTITPDPEGLLVIRVIPGAPAAEAGIEVGDILTEADGVKLDSTAPLLGEEGETVSVKVKRRSGNTQALTLTRRKFSTKIPETLTWLSEDTAVLKIPTFDRGYSQSNVEKLVSEAHKAKKLVLDLRSNGGGAVFNLMHLLGLFLPENTAVGTFISKTNYENYIEETGDDASDLQAVARWLPGKLRASRPNVDRFEGLIAVLVDGRSGSAAEMMAQALKDNLDAPVVGERSAGAVLASIFAPLPEGFQIQYPIQDYITMDGYRLEANGVVPDFEVKQPRFLLPGDEDQTVSRAIDLLHRIELREERNQGA